MKTSDVLNKAADHIQQYGHMRGAAFGSGSIRTAPACAVGAIDLAVIDDLRQGTPALCALRDHIEPLGMSIPTWSDTAPTDEVIATLRAVAVIEAARETAAETVSEPVSA